MTQITHLLPIGQFILKEVGNNNFVNIVIDYAKLLQHPPKLSDFIACDDNEIILPTDDIAFETHELWHDHDSRYQTAIKECLFSGWKLLTHDKEWIFITDKRLRFGFDLSDNSLWHGNTQIHTLEDLTKYKLPITDNFRQKVYGNENK